MTHYAKSDPVCGLEPQFWVFAPRLDVMSSQPDTTAFATALAGEAVAPYYTATPIQVVLAAARILHITPARHVGTHTGAIASYLSHPKTFQSANALLERLAAILAYSLSAFLACHIIAGMRTVVYVSEFGFTGVAGEGFAANRAGKYGQRSPIAFAVASLRAILAGFCAIWINGITLAACLTDKIYLWHKGAPSGLGALVEGTPHKPFGGMYEQCYQLCSLDNFSIAQNRL
jgi:succinate dehydrogenase/fumarate reductase cytochrome b subunit